MSAPGSTGIRPGAGAEDRIVRDDEGGFWQRSPGRPGAAIAAGVAGLALAAVVQYGGFATLGRVQDDLTARATAALQQAGYTGLTVTASGRDLTISGPADPAAVPTILDLVRAQDGVRVATFAGAGDALGTGPTATGSSVPASTTPTTEPTSVAPTAVAPTTATASPDPSGTAATTTPTATPTTEPTTATATAQPTATPAPSPTASSPVVNATGGSPEAAAAASAIAALPKIQFPTALSGPTADGRVTVTKIAAILKRYPTVKVQIQGHTDDLGTDRVNLELSAARADVVRTLLVAQGVKASRLTAKGYGETRPFVPNITDANRAVNRRVSFLLS